VASVTGVSAEIKVVRTLSGNSPNVNRIIENAAQTFLRGTIVQIDDATGSVEEWDGTTYANGIAGVSADFGADLTTAGVAKQPGAISNVVPYQASAVFIPRGAPPNDGKTMVQIANLNNVYYGQTGTAVAQANVGNAYGLTKDTDGHWYIDLSKATDGTNTAVRIVGLDPTDQGSTLRGVFFQFQSYVMMLQA
jgi:hypothetical protein